ncbi:pyrroline-5-carboxylate reductase [Treponema sp. OMZ 840]|uniref:pyrroline-5-carboxylate reductase n=1 Tax=Treponema sp. OMZ 840 TaxID=244313 RepID=UPI003D91B465
MKVGFIGCGNMARAMIAGIVKSGLLQADCVYAYDIHTQAVLAVQKELGIAAARDNIHLVETADIIVLAVKPQVYEKVIAQIKNNVRQNSIIVTITPGKTLAQIESWFGKPVKIVRTMPNTPATVGEGMTAVCCNKAVGEEELKTVRSLFESFGKTECVEEYMIDAVVGVSGSSPAYVFMLIEAMADAAVAGGMSRQAAYVFASQAVLGSAKMVLETGKHPGELKDMVCSPGGTTIEAVRILEKGGFRSAVMEAIKACMEKSRGM